jgi:hypothetical protein
MSEILREPAKVIADILKHEMNLDDAHCFIGDQPWEIPADAKLFVAVHDDGGPVVGVSSEIDTTSNPLKEIQKVTIVHDVRIEIMSLWPGNEARTRKEEVGMALESQYAQDVMDARNCSIGRIRALTNASESEVATRLLRYTVHANVTALHVKEKLNPPYYDKFNGATVDGTANPPEVNTNA